MNAGGYYIFDEMTSLIADAIDTQINRPDQWLKVRNALAEDIDFSGGINFVNSERHADYIDMDSYLRACRSLSKRLDWIPAKKRLEGQTESSKPNSHDMLNAAE